MRTYQPPSTDQGQPVGSDSGPMGGQTGPKWSKTEREAKMLQAALLDRKGYNQFDIARMIGVGQPMVAKYLKKNRERYQEQVLDLEQARLHRLLDQFADVRREAWEAWEITKGGTIRNLIGELARAMELAVATGTPLPDTITVKLRAMPANEFLQTVLGTLNAEAKVLGLIPTGKQDKGDGDQAAKAALFDALVAATPDQVPDQVEDRIAGLQPLNALPPPEPSQAQVLHQKKANGELPSGFQEQP